ncbi:MAG: hypothetical protein A2Z27_06105 [candidate division Zixibacteria bacterium RBG_16_50_21]|nr:MAG: hypothetical protein A2Z27_06105 [candidate division Zixibacteria bacterium RBG_16_50_21]
MNVKISLENRYIAFLVVFPLLIGLGFIGLWFDLPALFIISFPLTITLFTWRLALDRRLKKQGKSSGDK